MNMTRIYRTDQYARKCLASVTEVREKKGMDVIACDASVFYPEGGGQPSDTGTVTLRGIEYRVTSAHDESLEGPVWHYTDAPAGTFHEGDEITLAIDWDVRFTNMQRHLGEHMLSGTFYAMCGGVNKGFHMGEDYITIDIDLGGRMLTGDELTEAEIMVNKAVQADMPVTVTWYDSYEESLVMPVRKKVPHEGRVSVVTVGDPADPYDCIACCGTHPSSSGQVGLVAIYKCEPNKGMSRVYFDCGMKAVRHLSTESSILKAVSARYSCAPADLMARLDSEADAAAGMRRHAAALAEYVTEAERSRILTDMTGSGSKVYTYASDILTPDELVRLGFSVIGGLDQPEGRLLVLLSPAQKTCLLFSDGGVKCGAIVRENAGRFGGRGGGRDDNARALFTSRKDMEAFAAEVCKVVQ